MYRCDKCHEVTKPGERVNKIVEEKRDKVYEYDGVIIGKGWEVVREIKVCAECAKTVKN